MKQKDSKSIAQFTRLINAGLEAFNTLHAAGYDHVVVEIENDEGYQGSLKLTHVLQKFTEFLIKQRAELEAENQKK